MRLFIGHRLQGYGAPGAMGVVNDARFINCYWPKLDRPTRIFADGSSGIEVMGRTPRNVWFPDDTVFLSYYPDALYPAERAVIKAMPFRRGLVNLSPGEAEIWQKAYDEAVASFPPTHSVFQTPRHVNFLRHHEEKSRRSITLMKDSIIEAADGSQIVHKAGSVIEKVEYEQFVAELTPDEALGIATGKEDEAKLRDKKEFVNIAVKNEDKTPLTLEQWKAAR